MSFSICQVRGMSWFIVKCVLECSSELLPRLILMLSLETKCSMSYEQSPSWKFWCNFQYSPMDRNRRQSTWDIDHLKKKWKMHKNSIYRTKWTALTFSFIFRHIESNDRSFSIIPWCYVLFDVAESADSLWYEYSIQIGPLIYPASIFLE